MPLAINYFPPNPPTSGGTLFHTEVECLYLASVPKGPSGRGNQQVYQNALRAERTSQVFLPKTKNKSKTKTKPKTKRLAYNVVETTGLQGLEP